MLKYKIVGGYTQAVSGQVNLMLEKGWKLYGQPFASKEYVYQALTFDQSVEEGGTE